MDDAVQPQPYDEPAKVEPPKLDLASLLYSKFNDDGWPICPGCGIDDLWFVANGSDDFGLHASIAERIGAIVGCQSCAWTPAAAIPALLDEVARLTRELDEARQLVRDGLSSGPHWVAPAAAVARWDAEAAETEEPA